MLNLETRDRAFIIAEAGTTHASNDPEFRFRRAMKYVRAAAEARADSIKFQVFANPNPETMFCWQPGDESRSRRWMQSVLSLEDWQAIKYETESLGLMFLASVFEYETVEWLSELNVEATKVASRAAGSLDCFLHAPRPVLVSNGMHPVTEGPGRIVLECEANYPSTLRWQGGCPPHDCLDIGFSDHSGNPWRAIDAISRGCKLIEVHFYLDPVQAGPDLPASISYRDLEMICRARDAFATFRNEK